MSRRAPALTARAWLGAAAGSAAIHALVLAALVGGGAFERVRDRSSGASAAIFLAALPPPAFETAWIDIGPAPDLDEARAPTPAPETPPPPQQSRDAIAGDVPRDRPVPTAARVAEGRDRHAPAPDQGDRAGRTTDDAWRHDRSTMHAQLTNGASSSQPARLRTAAAASSSPQAVRRERVVGTGESTRSETPASPPSAPQRATPDESPVADSARSAEGDRSQLQVLAEAELPRHAEDRSEDRGVGPLDTERGARSFDSAARGATADDRSQRAASNEMHPGITDLSRAGVRARNPALSGRGPGDAPGAVDRSSAGSAPAELGLPRVQQVGDQVSGPTEDHHYDQYIREITRRVNNLRQFPRRLAVRLEQGETVVHFVVDVDGRIRSGVQVTKSSGFDEFDLEAARAVERAAPFPPLPPAPSAHALQVYMRVAFENPLVR